MTNLYITMYNVYMIQITAYLRTEEDLVRWKALPNKTQWLHDALAQERDIAPPRPLTQEDVTNFAQAKEHEEKLVPRPLTEILAEEEEDPYPGYKIYRLTGQVVDTINEMPVDEVTKEMVDYLKKNNRYV